MEVSRGVRECPVGYGTVTWDFVLSGEVWKYHKGYGGVTKGIGVS